MNLYCTCGARNSYSGVKPKKCHSCGELFERPFEPAKQAAKASKHPAPRSRWESDAEEDPQEESLSFDGSITFESTAKVTVADHRKNGGDIHRSYDPELKQTREEMLGKMLPPAGRPAPRGEPSS